MKKLLSLALVLVMILALIPAAHADELDDFIGYLNVYMQQNGFGKPGQDFQLSRTGRVLFFSVWGQGITVESAKTYAAVPSVWEPVAEMYTDLSSSYQEMIDDGEMTDPANVVAVLMLVDYEDKKTPILVASNGITLWDIVTGTALWDPAA